MKQKNYSFKLAFFITLWVIVPMYLLIFLLAILADVNLMKDFVLLYIINYVFLFIFCTTGAFLLLYVCLSLVYKKQKLTITDEYYIQNKHVKLKKDNLKEIIAGKLGKNQVYFLDFVPIKDSVWVSHRLKFYFATYLELEHFILKNSLLDKMHPSFLQLFAIMHVAKGLKIDENKKITVRLFPCPCCFNYTYTKRPGGTYFICPVCFFEDEKEALNNPDIVYSCNKVSLNQARKNFKEFKACKEEMKEHVRDPFPYEIPNDKQNINS